ncbi:hypothetical protein AAG906_018635 [Vitis piasezkii]
MTTRGVLSHTAIHFSIDGRHGIPYEPEDPSAFRQWSPVSQRDMVRILSKGTSANSILLRKELPPGMLLVDVGLYFGPHHLIMASLIHFEEKYMGFPIEPWLERRRLCRERFTLDKWNQLAGYSAPLGAPPMVAPPVPPQPEHGYFCCSASTPTVPPVAPTTSEPTITILALEFRTLVHTF